MSEEDKPTRTDRALIYAFRFNTPSADVILHLWKQGLLTLSEDGQRALEALENERQRLT